MGEECNIGTYIQWNINNTDWAKLRADRMSLPYMFTRDEEWLDQCLPTAELRQEYTKKVHWRMMLIGNKGAGMFNHIGESSFLPSFLPWSQ